MSFYTICDDCVRSILENLDIDSINNFSLAFKTSAFPNKWFWEQKFSRMSYAKIAERLCEEHQFFYEEREFSYWSKKIGPHLFSAHLYDAANKMGNFALLKTCYSYLNNPRICHRSLQNFIYDDSIKEEIMDVFSSSLKCALISYLEKVSMVERCVHCAIKFEKVDIFMQMMELAFQTDIKLIEYEISVRICLAISPEFVQALRDFSKRELFLAGTKMNNDLCINWCIKFFLNQSPNSLQQWTKFCKVFDRAPSDIKLVLGTHTSFSTNLNFMKILLQEYGWPSDLRPCELLRMHSVDDACHFYFYKPNYVNLFERFLPRKMVDFNVAFLSPSFYNNWLKKQKKVTRLTASQFSISDRKTLYKCGILSGVEFQFRNRSDKGTMLRKFARVCNDECDVYKTNLLFQKCDIMERSILLGFIFDQFSRVFIDCSKAARVYRTLYAIHIVSKHKVWRAQFCKKAAEHGYDDFVMFALKNNLYMTTSTYSTIEKRADMISSHVTAMQRGYPLPLTIDKGQIFYGGDEDCFFEWIYTLAKLGFLNMARMWPAFHYTYPELSGVVSRAPSPSISLFSP